MNTPFVAILMGSKNDLPVLQTTIDLFKRLSIVHEVNILSAHRTPLLTKQYVEDATQRGAQVFIAAAGLAAHLAGTIAAHTIKPVIGVPLDAGSLGGLDSLLSTVQMPGGIPVATTAIGKPGAHNAAILAAQILALHNPMLSNQLIEMRLEKKQDLINCNAALEQEG
jgi:5-(carboxyamino)imidazole ribonucleotide mutase